MSQARQQVVDGPSFTGWGYLPSLTPDRNEERPIGRSCRTCGSLSRPRGLTVATGAAGVVVVVFMLSNLVQVDSVRSVEHKLDGWACLVRKLPIAKRKFPIVEKSILLLYV